MRFQAGLLGSSLGPLFAAGGAHSVGGDAVRPVGGGRGLRLALATLALALGVLASALANRAGAYVYVTNESGGTIGEYTTSGATVNASLISGLNRRPGWRSRAQTSTSSAPVATRSGSTPRAAPPSTRNLVNGLKEPVGLALEGSNLYVTNYLSNTLGEYTTDGTTVNAELVKGLNGPKGVALEGSDLYVANSV